MNRMPKSEGCKTLKTQKRSFETFETSHARPKSAIFENGIGSGWITKKQLAQSMQVSLSTVDNWLARGMPHIKLGKAVRVDLGEVTEWHRRRSS